MLASRGWVSGILTLQSDIIHLLRRVFLKISSSILKDCVLSTLIRAPENSSAQIRIAIFTDNTNTVDILNFMRGLPAYNYMRSSVDVRMKTHHQLPVFHVPGHENGVANAISCHEFVTCAPAWRTNFLNPLNCRWGSQKWSPREASPGNRNASPGRATILNGNAQ